MLKKYPKTSAQAEELKIGPSNETINAILNYSKSVVSAPIGKAKDKELKILIHLN